MHVYHPSGQSITSTFGAVKHCVSCKNSVAGRYICSICKGNVHGINPCSDMFKEADDRPGKLRICRTCQGLLYSLCTNEYLILILNLVRK